MVEISRVLNVQRDGSIFIGTVSIPREMAQDLADALYFLQTRESAFGGSRSAVIVEAILGWAEVLGWERPSYDDVPDSDDTAE
mgnify:CR=1 FL=1